ncbi:MAG: pentapeptide repeat-containing protein [Synechococcales bacterium]|nr:pentapeptide repeat-containing protein [Synechococcales bacterium]
MKLIPGLTAIALSLGSTAGLGGSIAPALAENLEQTRQLLATKQCSGCNLAGAGLVLARLQGADLRGANLAGANLSQANLVGADLSGANLAGASLHGANLTGVNLTGANLSSVDFRQAYLAGANLTNAQLTGALLRDAIALPPEIGNADEFYQWGLQAGKEKSYEQAIEYFNQSLSRQPDYAPAWMARGAAKHQLGDKEGAIADMEKSAQLFAQRNDAKNADAATKAVDAIKNPPKAKTSFGQSFLGVVGGLIRLFMMF